jgi:hypothetical protein
MAFNTSLMGKFLQHGTYRSNKYGSVTNQKIGEFWRHLSTQSEN